MTTNASTDLDWHGLAPICAFNRSNFRNSDVAYAVSGACTLPLHMHSVGALSRRDVLLRAAQTAACALATPLHLLGEQQGAAITLTLAPEPPVPLPRDFTGLGYEMSSVAPLGLLSAENGRYVRLVEQLGRRGVIRVGGIVADYTRYDANGTIAAEPKRTVLTQASLQQFGGFLRRTGWTAIWSVNFAQGTQDEAAEEARAVAAALDSRPERSGRSSRRGTLARPPNRTTWWSTPTSRNPVRAKTFR